MSYSEGKKRTPAPKSWEPPPFIQVMSPQHQPKARGIRAVTIHDKAITYMSRHDTQMMKEEADACGLKVAEYMRWCVQSFTRELRRLRTGEGYTPDM